MGLDSYRIRETKKPKIEENKFSAEELRRQTQEINALLDSLNDILDKKEDNVPEYSEEERELDDIMERLKRPISHDRKRSAIDMEWIRKNESSEGKIPLTSDPQEEKPLNEQVSDVISNTKDDLADLKAGMDVFDGDIKHEETNVDINAPLEFTSYVGSLKEKYNSSEYHRMMNSSEINKYVELYTKAFNVDRKEALARIEDTINKQLNKEKSESDIMKQGLEQAKLRVLTGDYRSKYGNDFMAYLSDEELEKYSTQYLHAYDVRRSTVDKMYLDSLNNAYADKMINGMANGTIGVDGNSINNETVVTSSRTMGFSVLKMFALMTGAFVVSALFIAMYFVFK